MIDLILEYIPLPYTFNAYEFAAISDQISQKLVTASHLPTTIIALVLAVYLYKYTKNLSTLYLLLATVVFFLWGYFDLMSWTSDAVGVMFGWSLFAVFGITFTFLIYWFLYTFIKGTDVPLWQKVVSLLTIAPMYYTVLANTYLSDYYPHAITPLEIGIGNRYIDIFNITFLTIIILFTFIEYRKAQDIQKKKQILIAGAGVVSMLFIFSFTVIITNTLVFLKDSNIVDIGITTGEAYNISTYALFGMPIMVGFLGYLVAKHGAFGMRVLKSVGLVIIMMIILFVNIFI